MSQSTARTGPSGLVRPDTTPNPVAVAHLVQKGISRAAQLEAALDQIRAAFHTDEQPVLPESAQFSIETAKVLADKAPDLYEMSPEVAGRFRLISTFLTTALDEAGAQA